MKNLSRGGLILLFLFFFSLPIKSALAENLLIVEIQIAGEKASDDYIKIYNPTNTEIYLSNYRLVKRTKTSTKDYTIKSWSKEPESKISAGGFYLWANKDYLALPNVNTSTSQTIAQNNGIALRLGPENTGTIIDAVGWGDFNNILFEKNPYPENPGPNQRLKRKQIAKLYQDTNDNSQDFYLTLEEFKPPIYPFGIFLNEILPSPLGPDEKEEWIEIFNQNSFEIDLSGWYISDTKGKTTIYNFPKGTKISPQGFLILSRPTTKIILNNDGDSLNLIQPDGKIVDSVTYEKVPRGQSYNRIDSNWFWSPFLTPGKTNIISIPIKKQKEEIKETLFEKEVLGNQPKKKLPSIGEQILRKGNFFPFLIALIIAIFSGIIILILKRKIKKFQQYGRS